MSSAQQALEKRDFISRPVAQAVHPVRVLLRTIPGQIPFGIVLGPRTVVGQVDESLPDANDGERHGRNLP